MDFRCHTRMINRHLAVNIPASKTLADLSCETQELQKEFTCRNSRVQMYGLQRTRQFKSGEIDVFQETDAGADPADGDVCSQRG
ncbi:hypothetical protein MASR1M36_17630 [Candidatus Cloacimonadaceae bacterium]